jgi:cyclopropane fatty-acyl-phospholipid synthase-like methyltransferase
MNNIKGLDKLLLTVLPQLKQHDKFLDLGCGLGQKSLFLAKKGFIVTAVEKSKIMVEKVKEVIQKEKIKNIKVIHEDVLNFKIEANKFDVIMANNVLQFLPKDKALGLVEEVKDKIKNNGFIIISAFTITDPSFSLPLEKRFKTYFKPREIKKLFANFKIIYYLEDTILDQAHPGVLKPHKHGVVKIIGQKI